MILAVHVVIVTDCCCVDILVCACKAFPQAAQPAYAADLAAARHLSKHIWPSRYAIDATESNRNNRRYGIDHGVASIGRTKTPKSLKAALPILNEVLRRHRSYNYTRELQRIAPSKVGLLGT